jgi:acyl-CoA thioester hydrolase
MAYQKSFEVRWAEIDVNWHMRNTSYAELGTSTRVSFLSECGFPPDEFARQRFGPVILREETRYSREVRLGQIVTYTLLISGMSEDGSHFEMHHDVTLEDGARAATIHVEGSWMDLDSRKLRRPPEALHDAMLRIERTSGFRELRSLVRNRS